MEDEEEYLQEGTLITETIPLQVDLKSIKMLSLAYNNTLIYLAEFGSVSSKKLVHLSSSNHILWQCIIPCSEFVMMNDSQVIAYNIDRNQILLFDLKKRTSRVIKHIFKSFIANYLPPKIFNFPESKTFCVVECNKKQIRATYYPWSSTENQNPIAMLRQRYKQECVESIKKINHHSKICWKQKQGFAVFDLNSLNKAIRISYPFQKMSCFEMIWEYIDNNYVLIQTESLQKEIVETLFQKHQSTPLEKYFQQHKKLPTFLVLKPAQTHKNEGQLSFELTFSNFSIKGQEYILPKRLSQYRIEFIGHFMFLTTNKKDTPWPREHYHNYFFNFKTKELIAHTKIVSSHTCYCLPEWASHHLVEISSESIEQGSKQQLVMKITTFKASMRDLYMNCLLHLNEDFDDDLLQDAIELLT